MTAIQPTVHKLLCLQAFWVAILENGRLWLGAKKNISEELLSHICHL